MTRARSPIRLTLLALATVATLAPLAAHAVITRTRAADDLAGPAIASGYGVSGDARLAGDSGPVLNAYFGRFTLDDAVLRDDGQPLAAAVRALVVQISWDHVAEYSRHASADLTIASRAPSAGGLTVVSRRVIGNPSSGFRGRGYLDVTHDPVESGGGGVLVSEPPVVSLIAIGLGVLLMGSRRRAAESDRR